MLWIRKEFYHRTRGYNGEDVVIVGHTPTETLSLREKDNAVMIGLEEKFMIGYQNPEVPFDNSKPFRVPNKNILMMDTGSYLRGSRMSCVNILTGELWQNDSE